VALDLNSPPRLRKGNAVGFDLEIGWAMRQANIDSSGGWFDRMVDGLTAPLSFGALSPPGLGSAFAPPDPLGGFANGLLQEHLQFPAPE
jgi:hypothetical protein